MNYRKGDEERMKERKKIENVMTMAKNEGWK